MMNLFLFRIRPPLQPGALCTPHIMLSIGQPWGFGNQADAGPSILLINHQALPTYMHKLLLHPSGSSPCFLTLGGLSSLSAALVPPVQPQYPLQLQRWHHSHLCSWGLVHGGG